MKKFYTKLIALSVGIIILSTAIFCSVFFGISGIYTNNYQKGYVYQYRALQNADPEEPKIIVIGGSFMTYGVDSEQLSEETGMPVYTLGVHSGMGKSYTIETAKKFINDGDIVVFSFYPFKENDYGMELIYLTLDGESDMFWDFFKEHPMTVLKSAGAAVYTKLYGYFSYREKNDAEMTSAYDARAFDPSTGNFIYDRPELVVDEETLHVDHIYSIDEVDDSCFEKVDELNEFCKSKNASLYMIFGPIYEKAILSTEEEMQEYETALKDRMNAVFIADLKDVIMPLEYIYNGPKHMNNEGTWYYTHKIYEGLSQYVEFS